MEKREEEEEIKCTHNVKQTSDEVRDQQLQQILQRLENHIEVEGHDINQKGFSDSWCDDSMQSDISIKHDNDCMSHGVCQHLQLTFIVTSSDDSILAG